MNPPQPAAAGQQHAVWPWWALPGPGVAALAGLYLLTAVVQIGSMSYIQRDLHLSTVSYLPSTVGVYLLAMLLTLAVGLLVGARYPTSIAAPGIAFMIIGVVLDVFSPDELVLLVGRGLTGLGAGAAAGVAAALAVRITARPLAYTAGGLGLLALIAGPFVGGGIATVLSWRWIFLSTAPLLLAALVATMIIGIVLFVMRQAPHGRA
ncbi:MAG TPA: MFS transporter [Streptosporangiaceae bacterium]|jgi:MFS family permease